MEFLVEFALDVPAGTPAAEVERRRWAEASASARLRRRLQLGSGPSA
jgi:muconolactone delta-isomerase